MTLLIVFIYSLLIGSFLNVVICRIPSMIEGQNIGIANPRRSFCLSCKTSLGVLELIPVISFLWQKGKCKHCQGKISWQYPLVELVASLLSVLLVYKLGLSIQTGFYLLFVYATITLFVIDAQHQLLPDIITLPLLWLGLIANIDGAIELSDAVIGAVLGYLLLWSVYWGFKLITHKEGMGYGDFKLTAAIGAWFGWQSLPIILLIATTLGMIVFFLRQWQDSNYQQAFAFGPFLVLASFILLFFK